MAEAASDEHTQMGISLIFLMICWLMQFLWRLYLIKLASTIVSMTQHLKEPFCIFLSFSVSLTHNLLLDIMYEPHVCKKSTKIWQISFFKIEHFSFRYLWKVQEELALECDQTKNFKLYHIVLFITLSWCGIGHQELKLVWINTRRGVEWISLDWEAVIKLLCDFRHGCFLMCCKEKAENFSMQKESWGRLHD